MSMLEKDIEAKVCDCAKELGQLVYKFTSPARRAVPDRMFITRSGRIYFIEFKRAGQKATPAQEREHARLRAQCVEVWVVDSVEKGIAIVKFMGAM